MEAVRSMSGALAGLLVEAERAHKEAVREQRATDADWPCWYAGYISRKLVPVITGALVGQACSMFEEELEPLDWRTRHPEWTDPAYGHSAAGDDRRSHVRSAIEQAQTWLTDGDTGMRYPVAHVVGRVVETVPDSVDGMVA